MNENEINDYNGNMRIINNNKKKKTNPPLSNRLNKKTNKQK